MTLSSQAMARILSEGGSEFEALKYQIIPGKKYSFKSDSHGIGRGELMKLDDTMRRTVLLKSFGKDGSEKVISVPMEDLAITEKQINVFKQFANNDVNIRHSTNKREPTQKELQVFFDYSLSLVRLIEIWRKNEKKNMEI